MVANSGQQERISNFVAVVESDLDESQQKRGQTLAR